MEVDFSTGVPFCVQKHSFDDTKHIKNRFIRERFFYKWTGVIRYK